MIYAIKVAIADPAARTFSFTKQKTMYGGKHIAAGAAIFTFASESQGGQGLIARGVVTKARAVPRNHDLDRQTPRVQHCRQAHGPGEETAGTQRT